MSIALPGVSIHVQGMVFNPQMHGLLSYIKRCICQSSLEEVRLWPHFQQSGFTFVDFTLELSYKISFEQSVPAKSNQIKLEQTNQSDLEIRNL